MNWVWKAYVTPIGRKLVMAVTGLALAGFVVGHLAGNLQIFAGSPEPMNAYAHFLQSKVLALWSVRLVLAGIFTLHVVTGTWLYLENRAARPARYAVSSNIQATVSSRTMFWTGLLVFGFLVWHLAHFTMRQVYYVDVAPTMEGHPDVYAMVIMGFRDPVMASLYVLAMLMLWPHLRHALSSVFQTLGIYHSKYNGLIRLIGPVVATLVLLGNASIPLLVWLGCVGGNVP
jgi:succinate dehydrogenase / fumarate reductase cytochrome b subunit